MTAGRMPGSSASRAARTPDENRCRGVDDEVDDERPPAQPQLRALPVQVVDRLVDLGDGAGPHAAAPVQHPVHGGLRQPGLHGDLADPVRVPHAAHPEGFLRDRQGLTEGLAPVNLDMSNVRRRSPT